mgnify:FL=1
MATPKARTARRLSPPARRRRQRQIEGIRDDILRSAATAFARQGYRNSTMQEIAAAAGYTAASLYTYFENKEAIFEALVGMLVEEFFATFAAPRSGAFAERVEALLRAQYEVAEQHSDAFAFLMRMAAGAEPMPERRGKRHPREGNEAFFDALSAWMRQNAAATDLKGVDADEAARVLWGVSYAFIIDWVARPGSRLVEQAPRVASFFINGVRGGGG